MNIEYAKLKEVLLELEPSLEFDDSIFYDYPGVENGGRTSISLDGNHLTNLDTGDIPEDEVSINGLAPELIHPDLRNFETTHTKKLVAFMDNPMFHEAHTQLGKSVLDIVYLGAKYPVMAQRAQAVNYGAKGTEPEDCIIIRMYFEQKEADVMVIKIGWQNALKNILTFGIPSITAEALEERLSITLKG